MALHSRLLIAAIATTLTLPVSASYFSDKNINSDDNYHLDPNRLKNGTQAINGATSYSSHSSKQVLTLNLAPVESYAAAEKACRAKGTVYIREYKASDCGYKRVGTVTYNEYRVYNWNNNLKRCEDTYKQVVVDRWCRRDKD
ncbi:hypothetical protein DZF79_02965 [Vibrio parahaemolyticus]|nr:hypothetical protein [Vibrio parahaemolyticus]